jgi:hypothetical protein
MNDQAPKVEIVEAVRVGTSDLRWEKKAEELEFEALASVRAAAEKWGASLIAILGLVSTVLVVKGAEDITKLSSQNKVLVAIGLGIALIAAFWAAYQAAMAAQGTPKDLVWPSGASLRAAEREQALKAKRSLLESRVATGIAVILMAGAIALTWFGNQPESSGSTVLVTPAAGTPLCGKLVNGSSGLEIEAGSSRKVLPAGPYNTVTEVEACPERDETTEATTGK